MSKFEKIKVKVNGHAGFAFHDFDKPLPQGGFDLTVVTGMATIPKTPEVEKALKTEIVIGRGWRFNEKGDRYFDSGRRVALLEQIKKETEPSLAVDEKKNKSFDKSRR